MKLNRRDFIKGTTAVSAGAAFENPLWQVWEQFRKRSSEPLAIMQGVTNETTTQISVNAPINLKVHFRLLDLETQKKIETQSTKKYTRSNSATAAYKIRFNDLEFGHRYLFQVISDSNEMIDQRELKTLDTQKSSARIALLSCMNDLIGRNIDQMWAAVQSSQPDAILLLGDNVYGDVLVVHGPRVLWQRYVDTRQNLPFYHFRKLIPSFAIWDDHDFGKNNVMGNYTHREHSKDVFNSFYAQEPVRDFFERGPGISSSFDLFGHRFVMLDGRYFRDVQRPYSQVSYLGSEQMKWVEERLSTVSTPAFFCLGSQFFGEYQKSNFSYLGTGGAEFEKFQSLLQKTNQPILMASGDVHYSEVQKISNSFAGFDGFELTSSCLHSTADSKIDPNSRRLAGTLQNNFIYLDFNKDGSYQATCLGHQAKRFTVPLEF